MSRSLASSCRSPARSAGVMGPFGLPSASRTAASRFLSGKTTSAGISPGVGVFVGGTGVGVSVGSSVGVIVRAGA